MFYAGFNEKFDLTTITVAFVNIIENQSTILNQTTRYNLASKPVCYRYDVK